MQRDAARAPGGRRVRLPSLTPLSGRPDARLRQDMAAYAQEHDVRGLISELIVVSIYASFFSMANDVWKTCGSAHHDAVAIATTVATVGLVRWGTLSLVSLFTKPT